MFHKIFMVARNDVLFSAPLRNLQTPRVLDLGCGTGIWGIDMAEWVFPCRSPPAIRTQR